MSTMDLFQLNGQVAIVTGGSGLYGEHISTALCEAGAHVIIASRNEGKCQALADRFNERGYKASGMKLDLSDEQSIIAFIAEVSERYGRIDILVNNSVSRYGLNNVEDTTAEGWNTAQQVNGTGLMLISREAVKLMRAAGKGNIINIASIQGAQAPHFPVYGDTGMTSGVEYTFAKWGMIGMTKWMASYYGPYNIRVNAISPGGYYEGEDQHEEHSNAFVNNYKSMTPLGRLAEDDDIKGPIVFLASEASRYITGHNLLLDGGWTIW
ncbi:SDR family NAD(P)-dependent oxidoreductase [Paenibacillus sp. PAMC21692]|uniref:SDR family NAD(P)-dependent oxidoreductase n=1 Tax=Paenibacillus sp. PAMC21692 TaxID=2762320 RepID=UPI001C9AA29D|nr:SDR family oxidoreductase [Paenibacillus sp. PAMC21692]